MRISTTVNAQLDAAHIGPFHDRIHGHTWKIEARFYVDGAPTDGGELHSELMRAIAPLDHSTIDEFLGQESATSEGIAAYVLSHLIRFGAYRVKVWRSGAQAGAVAEI